MDESKKQNPRRSLAGLDWLAPVDLHTQLWRCVLGFARCGPSRFEGTPHRPFKPHGLAIWEAPPGTMVRACMISRDEQVLCSFEPAPARFFAQGDSYTQIAKLVAQGKEPPSWCSWSVVDVGNRVVLELEGSSLGMLDGIEVCMWGEAIRR